MKAIVLNIHDALDRRYKAVILANDNDNLEEIMNQYPYTEVESMECVDFVMDKTYKKI